MNRDPASLKVEVDVDPVTAEEFDAAAEGLRQGPAEELPQLSERTTATLIECAMRDESSKE